MKSFLSQETILEAAPIGLIPSQLKKPNASTGEDRIDILSRLVRDGKPLELAKGGTFTVTEIEDALSQIEIFKKLQKPFNLQGDGKTISSSELKKSKVFGGGGGAGGGTLNTKITESHNCVICQAMLDNGMQDEEYFKDEAILKAAFGRVYNEVRAGGEAKEGTDNVNSSTVNTPLETNNKFETNNMMREKTKELEKQSTEKERILRESKSSTPIVVNSTKQGDTINQKSETNVTGELTTDHAEATQKMINNAMA